MILDVENVSKTFGRLQALDGATFSVEAGEIFGIAGPNGAGKSTLFNVIAGTFPPSAGRIRFKGRDITKLKAHRVCHRGLARTFQIPQTFQTLTVRDNIRVGATFGEGAADPAEIEDLLAFFGLTDRRDTPARDLDLYTTKLVMMAASLATGCELLMLDEPLAGLSKMEIDDFLAVVRTVNEKRGVTLIIIEHILDSLFAVSGRILVLHNGAVIYTGDPAGVRRDPTVIEVYLGEGGPHDG